MANKNQSQFTTADEQNAKRRAAKANRRRKGSGGMPAEGTDLISTLREDRQARRREFQVNQSYLASMNPLVTGLTGLPRLVADAIIESFPDAIATDDLSQTGVAIAAAKAGLSQRELGFDRQVDLGVRRARKALSEAYEVASESSTQKGLVSV